MQSETQAPCGSRKWVVLQLSEDIMITHVVLNNLEHYSSSAQVHTSARMHQTAYFIKQHENTLVSSTTRVACREMVDVKHIFFDQRLSHFCFNYTAPLRSPRSCSGLRCYALFCSSCSRCHHFCLSHIMLAYYTGFPALGQRPAPNGAVDATRDVPVHKSLRRCVVNSLYL
jgi:hypothetical protein